MELLTLSHCRKLCELEVFVPSPNDAELNLVSSITSANIEKIKLTHSTGFQLSAGHNYWTQLDDILVRLTGRREYKVGLEVVFDKVSVTWDGKLDLGKYLPVFVEKGRMTVLDAKGQLVYCSDEVRR
jgi:hypothetical protein